MFYRYILICLLVICINKLLAQETIEINNYYESGKPSEKYFIDKDSLLVGAYKKWDEDGELIITGSYKNGSAEGKWIRYYSTGIKQLDAKYSNGEPDGTWRVYLENGAPFAETNYKGGVLDGEWCIWYIVRTPHNLIFPCGDALNLGTGYLDQCLLQKSIHPLHPLLKARGYFKKGVPVGKWTFYSGDQKEEEVIFKNSNDDKCFYDPEWTIEYIKQIRQFNEFSLAEIYCDELPRHSDYSRIIYNRNGKIVNKEEYVDGKKITAEDANN